MTRYFVRVKMTPTENNPNFKDVYAIWYHGKQLPKSCNCFLIDANYDTHCHMETEESIKRAAEVFGYSKKPIAQVNKEAEYEEPYWNKEVDIVEVEI